MADETKTEGKEIAVPILQGVGVVLNMLGGLPNMGPVATGIFTGLGGAANVLAGWIDKGFAPQQAITIWKSALADVAEANKRVDAEVARRTGGPK